MFKLEFQDPAFHAGRNYTVRLGEKWKERLHIGDFVELEHFDGVARVESILVCRLREIPQGVWDEDKLKHGTNTPSLYERLEQYYLSLTPSHKLEPGALDDDEATCIAFTLYKTWR
jgi:hypothetical protein